MTTTRWERDVKVSVPPEVFALCCFQAGFLSGIKHLTGAQHARGLRNDRWLTAHLTRVGALVAEWAVSKVTNTRWTGLDGRGERDTQAGEVKWSRSMDYGLLIPDRDLERDEHYWLVLGEAPVVTVVGPMVGMDIPAAGRLLTTNGRPPAWIVRASHILGWKP